MSGYISPQQPIQPQPPLQPVYQEEKGLMCAALSAWCSARLASC